MRALVNVYVCMREYLRTSLCTNATNTVHTEHRHSLYMCTMFYSEPVHICANLFAELITKFRSIHIFKQLDRQIQPDWQIQYWHWIF